MNVGKLLTGPYFAHVSRLASGQCYTRSLTSLASSKRPFQSESKRNVVRSNYKRSLLSLSENEHFRTIHAEKSSESFRTEHMSLSFNEELATITMYCNKINIGWVHEMMEILDHVEANAECKGLITIGDSKCYSDGFDIEWLHTLPAKEVIQFIKEANHFIHRLLNFPMATLAAINGDATAVGAVLAMTHDVRVMTNDRGVIWFDEVLNSIRINPFFLSFLTIKFGGGRPLSDALILSRKFSGQEAFSNHIIMSSVKREYLHGHSETVMHALCGRKGTCRSGMGQMKKDVFHDSNLVFEDQYKKHFKGRAKSFMTEAQKKELETLDWNAL